jgi:hypothetical protein
MKGQDFCGEVMVTSGVNVVLHFGGCKGILGKTRWPDPTKTDIAWMTAVGIPGIIDLFLPVF